MGDQPSEAMRRELEEMDEIAAHCRRHASLRGVTIVLRSYETGRLLRVLIALLPETDPRPRPISIQRRDEEYRWRHWLDAEWDRGVLGRVRDHHGPPILSDDDREDLDAVVERLRQGVVDEEP